LAALSRAWMLAVGTGAPCLIIECSGLVEVGDKDFEAGYKAYIVGGAVRDARIDRVGARAGFGLGHRRILAGERGGGKGLSRRPSSAVSRPSKDRLLRMTG